jgi:methylglutaconyl-CoA hydratase
MAERFETILVDVADSVARVTLHRPNVRNAFNEVMIRELRQVFAQLKDDPAVRAVVLTGEGTAFCAGADLHWMRQVLTFSFEQNLQDSLELAHLFREIYELPKPVVGRINGAAIGGGSGLVAVCDIAIASDQAVFSFSEVKIGLVPACISPYVLKRVGERYTREYFMTGERLDAARALHCGLVNRVASAFELDAAVDSLLRSLCSSGPQALATCKRMLREVSDMTLDQAGPATAEAIARMRMSDEGQEGMSAFLERRKPIWLRDS